VLSKKKEKNKKKEREEDKVPTTKKRKKRKRKKEKIRATQTLSKTSNKGRCVLKEQSRIRIPLSPSPYTHFVSICRYPLQSIPLYIPQYATHMHILI